MPLAGGGNKHQERNGGIGVRIGKGQNHRAGRELGVSIELKGKGISRKTLQGV